MAIEAVSDIRRAGTSAFAGGGGASVLSASFTVTPGRFHVDTTFGDETTSGVTTDTKVMCQLAPNADWDADDLADFKIFATPINGFIIFTIARPGPIVGTFLVNYTLG